MINASFLEIFIFLLKACGAVTLIGFIFLMIYMGLSLISECFQDDPE